MDKQNKNATYTYTEYLATFAPKRGAITQEVSGKATPNLFSKVSPQGKHATKVKGTRISKSQR